MQSEIKSLHIMDYHKFNNNQYNAINFYGVIGKPNEKQYEIFSVSFYFFYNKHGLFNNSFVFFN